MPLSLAEVADIVGGTFVRSANPADSAAPIADGVVRIDSRDVNAGDLFLAVVGEQLDGHDFVDQALDLGAIGTVAQRPVAGDHVLVDDTLHALTELARDASRRVPARCRIIGITGSSGKTSTKDLLAQVLEPSGETIAPPGSFNNEIGLPLTVLRARESTRYLVLEMGARGAGHIQHLVEVANPSVGVVLNVGSAHVGEFGGIDAVAMAKREIIESLPANGYAVLNADDERVAAMAPHTQATVVTFGQSFGADVRAVDEALTDDGRARFTIVHADEAAPVVLRLVGAHHVSNALAAASVALSAGLSLREVAERLSDAEPRSRWRMEVSETTSGITVVNDAYNANPESVAAAISATAGLAGDRRRWIVLGEMRELGASSDDAHREVGRLAYESGAARIVAVGGGAAGVIEGARAAGAEEDVVVQVDGPEAARSLLSAHLREHDVVLLKASRAVGLEVVAQALLSGDPA